ncbi:YihY/virulence factor BrkB family protein [Flavobacterium facile]|jgi:membrane protein|uniref:YihY/virulence factor BrkB family protein n=1 Tax=Flavobacterium facile TaxID=2893174 RepID=UPI002E789619|nr:YihY/virulence factor BrkB family protein [Flavobacterium sp. T-12]
MKFNKETIKNLPVIKHLIKSLQQIQFPTLQDSSLYDIIKLYLSGIISGDVTHRASAIAFSFFMALFPFALFLLNLIPFIPLDNFQNDFLIFVSQSVPPNTYDAIEAILKDILNNSYNGLLSSGFLLSIFLMSNGINALLDGFEMSKNISEKRGYFRQYAVAIALSLIMAFLLLLTVATLIFVAVLIHKIEAQSGYVSKVPLIETIRYLFVFLMILFITSTLYKFGTKESKHISFISYGSVTTTILFVLTSYVFGVYVEKFARYNELYGSIGTLLVMMFYVWLNCILVLLGFELNAFIFQLKSTTKEKT